MSDGVFRAVLTFKSYASYSEAVTEGTKFANEIAAANPALIEAGKIIEVSVMSMHPDTEAALSSLLRGVIQNQLGQPA